MENRTVSLAQAKAHLSELTELAAKGETVIITKRGKPIARVQHVQMPRLPVDLQRLRRLTAEMPLTSEDAGQFMRCAREASRFRCTTLIPAYW